MSKGVRLKLLWLTLVLMSKYSSLHVAPDLEMLQLTQRLFSFHCQGPLFFNSQILQTQIVLHLLRTNWRNTFLLNSFLSLYSPFFFRFFLFLMSHYHLSLLYLSRHRLPAIILWCLLYLDEKSPRCMSFVVSLGFLAILKSSFVIVTLCGWWNKKKNSNKNKAECMSAAYWCDS